MADHNGNSWWKESVVYEIYPRSFQDSNGDGIGDLQGVISRLGYLSELGIDVIWLCPVYDSPNNDNGYDIRDYYKIEEEYGSMEDMLELISAAKDHGIRVIMDLVANHTSDEHAWFVESRSSTDSPKRDWYIWKPGRDGKDPANWESVFGGSAWERDEATGEYYLHCFSPKQPDLNWENPKVRNSIYEMMEWWMDRGIAGFRIDAITYIKKCRDFPEPEQGSGSSCVPVEEVCRNQPGILDFLHEMKDRVLAPREAMTVAEAPGVPVDQIQDYVDETNGVFNMILQFDHLDLDLDPAEKGIYHSWKLTDFKRALGKWQTAAEERGWMALFLENHDHVRSVSKFGNDGRYRTESAKMLAVYYMLMKGTPFIYQGQELGMTNAVFSRIDDYRDIESVNMFREETGNGRTEKDILDYLVKRSRDQGRMPMQWSAGEGAGFTSGTPWLRLNPNYPSVNVEQSLKDRNSVLCFYRRLIRLRKENRGLIYGRWAEIEAGSDEIGGYTREYREELWTVLCNITDRKVRMNEPEESYLVLANLSGHEEGWLRPYEALVYKRDKSVSS